ncbi:ankyrin repeat domain-containing protein 39-like [Anopheles albimanus]|uniref:ankyrin repeat domain-containing protein 39-like n=1 Tax=Anopheles albimanus TaxID=7167 RepID=UPI0016418D34|nr:ankyrin repeat domain-containing protein 39-like [Anopheles albimanus]
MVHGGAGGDGAGCHGHQHHQCSAKGSASAVQSLDELDFDRGIWSAAMNNECDRLRTLVARGHLHDRDSCGYTALHYAARHGHLEACCLLLTAGLGVDEVTKGGVTSLQRAAMMGRDAIVDLLLANGANAAHRDADGRTALHRAAEGGHLRCCQLLVAHRADLRQIKDERNQKSFDLVRDHATDRDLLRCLLGVPEADGRGAASTTSS